MRFAGERDDDTADMARCAAEEKQQPYFINTLSTVAAERQSGQTIYPPRKTYCNAFRYTELSDVKVGGSLGQDPYTALVRLMAGLLRAPGRGYPPFSAGTCIRA
ncbi:Uracil DNA glycosylase [Enterobacter cloacae]|uniref:Uracil DNA glycosylase n=1 Tax=Enterobacter cloacae TaxID=550 RepID=A0A377LU33_ENTCL|nr:Uracil DNA glycosylase [Enterobacter cloacae]